jgi:predicted restriction endonuclease
MLRLEALYTAGGEESITRQLIRKTELLLGPQEKFRSVVKRMYDYRSRFIHGQISFPSAYCEYEGTRSFESYVDEIGEASDMALAILIATLQKMAREDRTSVRFEYILSP